MKKSELKQIIREEIEKALNEYEGAIDWTLLGDGFEYVETSKDLWELSTPYGFTFSYDQAESKRLNTDVWKSEIRYLDYGSTREEGEAIIDPKLDELTEKLDENSIEWKILTTSQAYYVYLYQSF